MPSLDAIQCIVIAVLGADLFAGVTAVAASARRNTERSHPLLHRMGLNKARQGQVCPLYCKVQEHNGDDKRMEAKQR